MPEETQDTAPAEEQVTPTEDTDAAPSEEGNAEASVDYEKRYNDLRSEHDRRVTEWKDKEQELELLEAIRNDPETQQRLYQELTEHLNSQEEDDEEQEFEPLQDPRVDELQQQFAAMQEAQQVEQIGEYVEDTLDTLEEQEGLTLNDKVRDWIVTRAVNLEPNEQGLPDISTALTEWKEIVAEDRAGYTESKRAPAAPKGQSTSKQPDLSNAAAKADYINRRLNPPGI